MKSLLSSRWLYQLDSLHNVMRAMLCRVENPNSMATGVLSAEYALGVAGRIPLANAVSSQTIEASHLLKAGDKDFAYVHPSYFSLLLSPEPKKAGKQKYRSFESPSISGNFANYLRFATGQAKPLRPVMVLNLLLEDTPARLGCTENLEAAEDPFIGAAVGPKGLILVIRPDRRTMRDGGEAAEKWDSHLSRGAHRVATVTISNSFVRDDNNSKQIRAVVDHVYRNYDTWTNRLRIRHNKRYDGLLAEHHHLQELRKLLGELRIAVLQHSDPTEFAQTTERLKYTAASTRLSTIFAARGAMLGSADNQASIASETQALLKTWNENGTPGDIAEWINRALHKELAPRVETFAVGEWWGFRNLTDAERSSITSRIAAHRAALKEALEQPVDADEPAKCARSVALKSLLKKLSEEHGDVYSRLRDANRNTPTLNRTAFTNARDAFLRRAHKKLSYAHLHVDLWQVETTFALHANEPERRGWLYKQTGPKGEEIPAPQTAPVHDDPLTFTVSGPFDSLSPLFEEISRTIANRAAPLPPFESHTIPDLGNIPEVPMSALAAPKIVITPKLTPRFLGAAEAYLIANSNQRIYNPAIGRSTEIRRALLERPTLIAYGAQRVTDEFKQLGFQTEVSDVTINHLSRLAERSTRNKTPLRPILPFEATAYYEFGNYEAQATVLAPDGTPIWIAGKTYTITPGWVRRSQQVNEEEIPEGLGAAGVRAQLTIVEYAVATFHVTAEGNRRFTISEDKIREEAELSVSAEMFPKEAAAALGSLNKNKVAPPETKPKPSNIVVAPGVQLSEEEEALLVGVNLAITDATRSASAVAASAKRPANALPPKPPAFPQWAPYLDEMVLVFPPPTPACVDITYQEEIAALMRKIHGRFGPKWTQIPVSRRNNGVEMMLPADLEQRAFAIFAAERCKGTPPDAPQFASAADDIRSSA